MGGVWGKGGLDLITVSKVFMFISVKSESIISDHGKVFMFITVKGKLYICDHGKILLIN